MALEFTQFIEAENCVELWKRPWTSHDQMNELTKSNTEQSIFSLVHFASQYNLSKILLDFLLEFTHNWYDCDDRE